MEIDHIKRNPFFLNVAPNRLCRICDSKGPIREVFTKVDLHLADDIYAYFRIKITNNDIQSKMVCVKCMDHIERFRKKRVSAKKNQTEINSNIKKVYGSMVEEIGNKVKFRDVSKLLNEIVKPKMELLNIEEIKIEELKMEELKTEELKREKLIMEEIKIKDLKMYKPKIEEFKFVPKIKYIPPTKKFIINEVGDLFCEHCEYTADTIHTYLAHLIEEHRIYKKLKSNEIKLCPLCDFNFENKNFLNHLQKCTDAMKVVSTNVEQNQFMCHLCSQMFPNLSNSQFRRHFIFCKNFQPFHFSDSRYYKCRYCTFVSYDVEKSMTHASSTCLYYQMNLKYAKSLDEKPIVESPNKIKNEINCFTTVPDIKPLIGTKSICQDLSNFTTFFNYHYYYCTKCLNVFVDKHSFCTHLNDNKVKCRSQKMWYCKMCVTDFKKREDYLAHKLAKIPCYVNTLNLLPFYNKKLNFIKNECIIKEYNNEEYDI